MITWLTSLFCAHRVVVHTSGGRMVCEHCGHEVAPRLRSV